MDKDEGTHDYFMKITEELPGYFKNHGVQEAKPGRFYVLQCVETGTDCRNHAFVKFKLVPVDLPIKVGLDGNFTFGVD